MCTCFNWLYFHALDSSYDGLTLLLHHLGLFRRMPNTCPRHIACHVACHIAFASLGLLGFLTSVSVVHADVSEVHVTDDQWQLELLAEQPDIVTPIGIACDARGRLLVIESHTHKRPDDYEGPPADRIRLFQDSDGDGQLDLWSTFHEGLYYALNLTVHGDDVYVVTSEAIVRLRDTNGDDQADEQTEIIRFECEENKAHSALVGLSFASDETLFFSLGKNTGKPYRVVGTDGKVFAGAGEGGSVFRCRPDGTQLERIATGLWNPWGLCVDPFDRVFCTENDPDSSPPCQLLHIVPGGDYGFQMRFGRDGRNPLQSRNGQLPGTLGMVCGIGESPCDIKPYHGKLWIASWVDHAVRAYQLDSNGASFRASRKTIVQGNTDFRPVGLAPAPDGSLYISDWVDRSYPVHGKGRIWRLSRRSSTQESPRQIPAVSDAEKRAKQLHRKPEMSALSASDPFLRQAAIFGFSKQDSLTHIDWKKMPDAMQRLGVLEAMRWKQRIPTTTQLHAALHDPHKSVRMFTVRWIAEQGLREHHKAVLRILETPNIGAQEYLLTLAAADWLDRGALATSTGVAEPLLAKELESGARSAAVQSLILRLLPPDHKILTPALLGALFENEDAPLRLEAVRTLSLQSKSDRFATLADIAGSDRYDQAMRLEAIMGLAGKATEHHQLLQSLASNADSTIVREATRALRLGEPSGTPEKGRPPATDIDAWLALVEQPGDAESGRRLFFSSAGPLCSRCHRFNGRGGTLAPDLTLIGQQQSRRRILTSILQPSAEMDMQYTPWILESDAGKVYTGLPADSSGDHGIEKYYDSDGKLFSLPSESIESRMLSDTSIMPSGLDQLMTIDDLRDLIALLMSSKKK